MISTGATVIIRIVGDPASPGSFGGWLSYTAINHSWVVSFVIMDSFLFFGVITLRVIQASQISRNVLTNEMVNALRYSYLRGPGGRFRNPFDHGVCKNCSDFFLKGYNEDIERAEQTVRPDEEMGTIQMTRSAISQNGKSVSLHVNGTDHGCADSQANSKSHRPLCPSKGCAGSGASNLLSTELMEGIGDCICQVAWRLHKHHPLPSMGTLEKHCQGIAFLCKSAPVYNVCLDMRLSSSDAVLF